MSWLVGWLVIYNRVAYKDNYNSRPCKTKIVRSRWTWNINFNKYTIHRNIRLCPLQFESFQKFMIYSDKSEWFVPKQCRYISCLDCCHLQVDKSISCQLFVVQKYQILEIIAENDCLNDAVFGNAKQTGEQCTHVKSVTIYQQICTTYIILDCWRLERCKAKHIEKQQQRQP